MDHDERIRLIQFLLKILRFLIKDLYPWVALAFALSLGIEYLQGNFNKETALALALLVMTRIIGGWALDLFDEFLQ